MTNGQNAVTIGARRKIVSDPTPIRDSLLMCYFSLFFGIDDVPTVFPVSKINKKNAYFSSIIYLYIYIL